MDPLGNEEQGKVSAQSNRWEDQQHILTQFVSLCAHWSIENTGGRRATCLLQQQ